MISIAEIGKLFDKKLGIAEGETLVSKINSNIEAMLGLGQQDKQQDGSHVRSRGWP
jgi:hypothetical protein